MGMRKIWIYQKECMMQVISLSLDFLWLLRQTVLSWAILEYGDHMNAVKQLEHAQDSLKWITDYLINSHPSANVLSVQVCHLFLTITSFWSYDKLILDNMLFHLIYQFHMLQNHRDKCINYFDMCRWHWDLCNVSTNLQHCQQQVHRSCILW